MTDAVHLVRRGLRLGKAHRSATRQVRVKALLVMALFFFASDIVLASDVVDIVVVVHKDNPVESLTRNDVVNLYMGRRRSFAKGYPAIPLDHASDSNVRREYYRRLVGKSVAQMNAYWARLLFTGRTTPPHVFADSSSILNAVKSNPGALAYLPSGDVGEGVKVVFRLGDKVIGQP